MTNSSCLTLENSFENKSQDADENAKENFSMMQPSLNLNLSKIELLRQLNQQRISFLNLGSVIITTIDLKTQHATFTQRINSYFFKQVGRHWQFERLVCQYF